MGNDVMCTAIGLGTVKLKMLDRIVRTLTNVIYILEFKKILISLGILDLLGYGYLTREIESYENNQKRFGSNDIKY